MRRNFSGREINAFLGDGPVTPQTCLMFIEHQSLVASSDGHPPDAGHGSTFRIVEEPSVRGFEAFKAALPGNLHRWATLGRHLPDLHAATASAAKINPPAVSGPTRRNVLVGVKSEATRLATFGTDYIDIDITFDP